MSWNNSSWILVLSVMVASFSQILLKKSALKPHISWLREYMNVQVISAYLLLLLSTILTILAYRGITYKNGIMIDATGYLFIMVLSFLFFKEKITRKKLIGNILIVIGLIVYYQ
ncbi:MAG: EamA family transporter [Eubacteriales bacterium]